jgi:hypothetical protein
MTKPDTEQLDALAAAFPPTGALAPSAFPPTTAADLPRARVTDPPTSHAAARAARRGVTIAQLAVLDVFQWCRREAPRTESVMTHEMLIRRYDSGRRRVARRAWYPDITESSVRTRCKELVAHGYVQHVDDGGVNDRGRKCARWACTTLGQVYDIELARAQATVAREHVR